MKNKGIIIGIIVILVIGVVLIFSGVFKGKDDGDNVNTFSEVEIGSKTFVLPLEKINIKGTNDYFMITEKVKWPKDTNGAIIESILLIPYTITVDGVEYDGTYHLGDSGSSVDDKNPKYNFKVSNLIGEGKTEVLISLK